MSVWYVQNARNAKTRASRSTPPEFEGSPEAAGDLYARHHSNGARGVDSEAGDIGPLRPSQLLELVRRGKVKPETMLRKDDSAWFPASSVGGLFEAAVAPTYLYHCPQCGAQVTKPPCTCPKCDREIAHLRPQIITNQIDGDEPPGGDDKPRRSMQNWLSKVNRRKQK